MTTNDGQMLDWQFLQSPDGWAPLEAFICVKYLDPAGNIRYKEIKTPTLHPIEALGMVTTAQDTLRSYIMATSENP
jgi:hypothetical protein